MKSGMKLFSVTVFSESKQQGCSALRIITVCFLYTFQLRCPAAAVTFLLSDKTSVASTFFLKIITESLGLHLISLLVFLSIRECCRD